MFRNRTMTLASIFSITAMLLILGLFFMLAVNVNVMAEDAKKQFDTIEVFIQEGVDAETTNSMMVQLREMPEVKEALFITKDQAMEEFKVKWGENGSLLDGVDPNILPASIRVTVTDLENADKVYEKAKSFSGVEQINYYQDTVDSLLKITNFIKTGAMIVIGFLVVVSIVVVSNTIKLTVMNREREISIMKYVGATNWFIRGPFLAEGILIGMLSAAVSVGLVSLVYGKVTELLSKLLMFIGGMVPLGYLAYNLIWIFMALGISIGAFGSIVSMRRFLDT